MPLISGNNYKPSRWLFNGHIETIYPTMFRKVSIPFKPKKITIQTPDTDYFELNHYDIKSNRTLIISHGLEGNNERPYVMGMTKLFFLNGWNVITWNYRGCNGKVNNSIKSYHSGFTEDLEEVVQYANKSNVKTISFVGFSLGGNLTLKYLGDANKLNDRIKSAVTFSVPLDLHKGCLEITKSRNFIYSQRFLRSLKQKVREKAKIFPEIQIKHLSNVQDLLTFDDYFTAPMHGFKDALDYYHSCSSIYVLDNIQIPTLIVNALNDPFLPKECYPFKALKTHEFVHLETPSRGGHVGFCSFNGSDYYWSEKRAFEFIESMK